MSSSSSNESVRVDSFTQSRAVSSDMLFSYKIPSRDKEMVVKAGVRAPLLVKSTSY